MIENFKPDPYPPRILIKWSYKLSSFYIFEQSSGHSLSNLYITFTWYLDGYTESNVYHPNKNTVSPNLLIGYSSSLCLPLYTPSRNFSFWGWSVWTHMQAIPIIHILHCGWVFHQKNCIWYLLVYIPRNFSNRNIRSHRVLDTDIT